MLFALSAVGQLNSCNRPAEACVHHADNHWMGQDGKPRSSSEADLIDPVGNNPTGSIVSDRSKINWPEGYVPAPVTGRVQQVLDAVLSNVGAWPRTGRDRVDLLALDEIKQRTGLWWPMDGNQCKQPSAWPDWDGAKFPTTQGAFVPVADPFGMHPAEPSRFKVEVQLRDLAEAR